MPGPSLARLAHGEDDGNVAYAIAKTEAVVVLSQTCDVVREAAVRPFVSVARQIRLAGSDAEEAGRGRRPRYAAVPAAGPDAFADLDSVCSIEKSVLSRVDRIEGLRDDGERRHFSATVSRHFGRFAFPDDLTSTMGPMIKHVRRSHGKDSLQGRAYQLLEEIRVTATPRWDAAQVDVFVIFAPPTRIEAELLMAGAEWDSTVDGWLERAVPTGVIRNVEGAMIPLDELSVREYLDTDRLELYDLTRH